MGAVKGSRGSSLYPVNLYPVSGASKLAHDIFCLMTNFLRSECSKMGLQLELRIIGVLVAQRLGRRTFDQAVAGLTPGLGTIIKSCRSTQPSILPG